MSATNDETVDISEAIAAGAAAIWDESHQYDSFRRGRTWELASQGVPGMLEKEYERDVAHTRWVAGTAIIAAWDWLREYFYSEYEDERQGKVRFRCS